MADKTQRLLNQLKGKVEIRTPIATDMFLPNHSGMGSSVELKKIQSSIIPKGSDLYDIGSTSLRFKDYYASGSYYTNNAAVALYAAANSLIFAIAGTTSGLFFDAAQPKNISLNITGVKKHIFYMGGSAQEGAFHHIPRTGDPTGSAVPAGSMYVFDDGASVYWIRVFANGKWANVEQRETITATPGATVTLTHDNYTNVYAKWTIGENETINASGTQSAGQRMSLLILQDGTGSRTITFGTGFLSQGILIGVAANKTSSFEFVSDGTNWHETSRVASL